MIGMAIARVVRAEVYILASPLIFVTRIRMIAEKGIKTALSMLSALTVLYLYSNFARARYKDIIAAP